jgi:hypothetical protein
MISKAVTDMPYLLFVEELLAAYSDANIVLNTRDPNSWWKSYQSTVASVLQPSLHKRFLAWLDPSGSAKAQYFSCLGFTVFFRTEHATEQRSDFESITTISGGRFQRSGCWNAT